MLLFAERKATSTEGDFTGDNQWIKKTNRLAQKLPPPCSGIPEQSQSKGPWEVVLCGDLTDRQAELLEKLTEVAPRSRGIMYFDSCGGSVYTGLALATLIRTRGLQTTAVVIGECSSAALLPFAACQPRFVTPQSTLLFHPMRWQSEEDVRLEEATEWARHFKQLEADLDQILVNLLPIDLPALHQWTRPADLFPARKLRLPAWEL